MTQHHEINVSPFATNVLDLVGRDDLVTPKGVTVRVEHFTDFHVYLDGEDRRTFYTNLCASAFLNAIQVGVKA